MMKSKLWITLSLLGGLFSATLLNAAPASQPTQSKLPNFEKYYFIDITRNYFGAGQTAANEHWKSGLAIVKISSFPSKNKRVEEFVHTNDQGTPTGGEMIEL